MRLRPLIYMDSETSASVSVPRTMSRARHYTFLSKHVHMKVHHLDIVFVMLLYSPQVSILTIL